MYQIIRMNEFHSQVWNGDRCLIGGTHKDCNAYVKKVESINAKIDADPKLKAMFSESVVLERLTHTEEGNRLTAAGKVDGRTLQKVCPHCGKVGAGNVFGRWHFDNCRSK